MLALSAAFNAFGQRDLRFHSVAKKIDGLVSQRIPAISIGVAQDGRIIWEEGFGWADRERRRRANAHTIYNIGSTSKPITAAAIMLMAEKGRIALDSPASDLLRKDTAIRTPFGDLRSLTVRRLLNHTSGLSRHSQMFLADEIRSVPRIDETIRRYGVTAKPVGESFEYSNLGYAVLSEIIAQNSGMTFADFVRREVFRPLGMKNSYYGNPGSGSVAMSFNDRSQPVGSVVSDTPGAADIHSSVHDLLLFGMFLSGEQVQNPLLNAATLEEMRKESSDRGVSKYGLGLESLEIGKYKLIFHHGSNGYGTSIFAFLPEKRICVAILSNITTSHTAPLLDEILINLVPDYEQHLTEFKKLSRPVESRPFRSNENYRGHWKGTITTWKEESPVEMWFQDDGDVQIQIKGQYRHLLNGVRMENEYFRGSFQGDLGTPDTRRYRANLHLKIRLRAGRMSGAITSSSLEPAGNVLSSLIRLEKQP